MNDPFKDFEIKKEKPDAGTIVAVILTLFCVATLPAMIVWLVMNNDAHQAKCTQLFTQAQCEYLKGP